MSTRTFWTAGNSPTQQIARLTEKDVAFSLKCLYLLSDTILAAASFYFESGLTRKVTRELEALFVEGHITYFVSSDVESFEHHGERKLNKSPNGLVAYKNRKALQKIAKELDGFGHIFRRSPVSMSDGIVELWIQDLESLEIGSLRATIIRNTESASDADRVIKLLREWAESRQEDFVWELIEPKLRAQGINDEALFPIKKRLEEFYVMFSNRILNTTSDRGPTKEKENVERTRVHTNVAIFARCLRILGVHQLIERASASDLIVLKNSFEFHIFRNFYFALFESATNDHVLEEVLVLFREAEKELRSSTKPQVFLGSFTNLLRSRKTGQFDNNIDQLRYIFDAFNKLPLESLVDKLTENLTSQTQTGITMPERKNSDERVQIFVSHSAGDVVLATKIVGLLRSALRIEATAIRCTSVDGYRLPAGSTTSRQLREEILNSSTFIALVSDRSLDSAYVLFELGARWGADLPLVPLLAKGFPTTGLRGPLTELNALSCDSRSQMLQFLDELAGQLGVEIEKPAVYESEISAVLDS